MGRDRRSQVVNLILDVLGVLFLLATLFSIFVVVFLIFSLPDPDAEFPFGAYEIRAANARFLKISGIVLFGLFAILGWGVANMLLDHPVGSVPEVASPPERVTRAGSLRPRTPPRWPRHEPLPRRGRAPRTCAHAADAADPSTGRV